MPFRNYCASATVDEKDSELTNQVMLQAIDSLVLIHKIAVFHSEVTCTTICDVDHVEETRQEMLNF